MIDNAENKMVGGAVNKAADISEATIVTAVGPVMNRYFFPGVPDYEPLSVDAPSYDQALAIWKTRRKPVVNPEKVEEPKANNE